MRNVENTSVPTVFLDRDGVINRKPASDDYVKSWDEFEFLPGVLEAIATLHRHGFRIIVVTNQRGVALGRFTEADLTTIHQSMIEVISRTGGSIAAIYYCPHDQDCCDCRKPQAGLFFRAQHDFPDISFVKCAMIGDSLTDMQAAEQIGCRKILVGNDPDVLSSLAQAQIRVDFFSSTLDEAVRECLLARKCHTEDPCS
jgi:D-glycero-D-manno-heptose 1,7-bisphosphate phosphatase